MDLGKTLTKVALKARSGKVKDTLVRKASQFSQSGMRNLFRSSQNLRHLSMGGAFLGMGLIMLLAVIYDKLKASSQRTYCFVNNNFDTAARAWKRRPELQNRILAQRFWRIYELAIIARDIKPPYHDRDSFLRIANQALDQDLPLLEGYNAQGQPARIPFRQAQKLFAAPPLSTQKNSVNDLRFSWYRDIRDRHLGRRRFIMGLTQSSPFENYLLLGLRRDVVTMISRGLKKSESAVRLEDVLGTSNPEFVDERSRTDRDRIRAFTARKVLPKNGSARDLVWRVLEDGLENVIKEIMLADPVYLTGESFVLDDQGRYVTSKFSDGMIAELKDVVAQFGPERKKPHFNFDRITRVTEEARELTRRLLDFLQAHDAEKATVQDPGDVRAIRVALQIDRSLRKQLLKQAEPEKLLEQFAGIARRQTDYDRALIELRGVYECCLADIELYNVFVEENFSRYVEQYPEADFDPWTAKIFPVLSRRLRNAWRRLRQGLQVG